MKRTYVAGGSSVAFDALALLGRDAPAVLAGLAAVRDALVAAAHIAIWKRGSISIGISVSWQGSEGVAAALLTTAVAHNARLGHDLGLVHNAMPDAVGGAAGRYAQAPGGAALLERLQLRDDHLHIVASEWK